MALWVGVRQDQHFTVTETVIPAQRHIRTSDGVCVMVPAKELHRLNVWLYKRGLTLLAIAASILSCRGDLELYSVRARDQIKVGFRPCQGVPTTFGRQQPVFFFRRRSLRWLSMSRTAQGGGMSDSLRTLFMLYRSSDV
ncbi:hypothetical protein QO004_006288 [Rhizobium mesoamericanum]|nr:hypothetical protein [Rhizobium mesoamericanum]